MKNEECKCKNWASDDTTFNILVGHSTGCPHVTPGMVHKHALNVIRALVESIEARRGKEKASKDVAYIVGKTCIGEAYEVMGKEILQKTQPEATMERHWCMCVKLKGVYRDGFSTCSICGGKDAYGTAKNRPQEFQKELDQ